MTQDPMADDLTSVCTRPLTGQGRVPRQGSEPPAARSRTLPLEGLPAPDSPLMPPLRRALYLSKAPAGLTQRLKRNGSSLFYLQMGSRSRARVDLA
jgi:hypothetical protein